MLQMTRPYRHRTSGVFWIRKRVPKRLQAVVGKTEEKFSLDTRDSREAKARAARKLLEIEERWAGLKTGLQSLSEKQANELANSTFHKFLNWYDDNPSYQTAWDIGAGEDLWNNDYGDPFAPETPELKTLRNLLGKRVIMRSLCEGEAADLLQSKGMTVDTESGQRLVRAVGYALQRAALQLRDQAKGLYRDRTIAVTPHFKSLDVHPSRSVGIYELYDGWSKESGATARTKYSYKGCVRDLSLYVGHEQASEISRADIVAWKDSLLEAKLSAKTIRDGKLAPIRAIFEWGARNGKLDVNPATKVTINVRKIPGEVKRGYTDEEASLILMASLREEAIERFWIPWMCATSGARLTEISQLRREDIFETKGIWCFRFTSRAGSIKNVYSERVTPIHSVLIERGFLKFVESRKQGPLFDNVSLDRFGNRGGNTSKRLSPWIRAMGITDKTISPNHAWRHRFATLARRFGLDPNAANAITGHAPADIAAKYGTYEIEYLRRELEKIPRDAFLPKK